MAGGRIKGITVEIGGDTTKLQTALQGVNKEIKNTQAQLKDVEKLLKLDPGNTELLAQKEKLLSDAVKETKEKLEALKIAAEQANTALANGDISKEQYDALQRELIETENNLKQLEAQANQSGTALQKIAANGDKIKDTGDKISSVGKNMLPVTAAVTGLGTAAVGTAANFESSMSQVQATMGITSDSMSELNGKSVNTMDALSNLAKEMGASTAFSASECAEALNYLALAGYNTQEMADTLPTVLNLAAAGSIDLASASDMVTDAMSALGMETSDADKMVDQMAKTASTTNTSVAQLGEGILTIGATAKTVKGGTAELSTALGILANNGIKGAEGGTHLRNIILSLQTPMNQAADTMKKLGVSVYDSEGNMRSLNDILGDLNASMAGMTSEEKTNIISKIFNKTDLSSVNALLSNTGETWDSLQSSIEGSAGAAKQMADTQLNNLQGQLTLLKSALEGLAISIGELLMPYVKMVVGWIQIFVDWLNSLDSGTQKVIVTISLIVAAIGPILIIVGKLLSSVGTIMTIAPQLAGVITTVKTAFATLNTTLLANPIVQIIAGITALVAAFIYLWNTNEGFRQFWIQLWESIKSTVYMAIEGIKIFLTTSWNAIKTSAETIWNSISAFFMSIWTSIKTTITNIVTGIKITISSVFQSMKVTITSIINAIKTTIVTVFTNIKVSISSTIGNIKSVIVTGFNAAFSFIKSIPAQAVIWGKDMIQGIVNGIRSMIGAVKSAVSSVASAIRSFLHFSVPDEGPLTDYESWMPDFMQGLAKGIKGSKRVVEKAIDGVANTMNFEHGLPNMTASLNATVSGNSQESNNTSVTLNQPIMLDGKTITTLVSQIQYRQGQAVLRNIGMV